MKIGGTCPKCQDHIWPSIPLQGLLLLGLWGLVACATQQQVWDPALWDRMTLAAAQANERGDTAAAERLCVEAFQYVDASVIRSFYEYASLLEPLNRAGAEEARARAGKVRELRTGSGSVYLGWRPSDELRAYAGLLRELGRSAEAEAMRALAAADDQAQLAHYHRLQEQALQKHGLGRGPMGLC